MSDVAPEPQAIFHTDELTLMLSLVRTLEPEWYANGPVRSLIHKAKAIQKDAGRVVFRP